jgi:aminoglycoside phosphotransferase (APT) family kinase protein
VATVAEIADESIELNEGLVRALLAEQHPDLADETVTFAARGWDNQIWRLGDDLAVRLPWQTADADELLLKEHRWVPTFAPKLPFAVPVPQRLGEPSAIYPHPWLVTTWVPGTPADRAPVSDGESAAEGLASFLTAMHQPVAEEAPVGRGGRGGRLAQVEEGLAWQLDLLADLCAAVHGATPDSAPDAAAVRAIWNDALSAPEGLEPPLWLHGDLHPANVLTANGRICGVIDFGDLCSGDPALDIASAWILLPDAAAIRRFRRSNELAQDEATWRRARGWVIWRALGSILIAIGDHDGAKPSWGLPAVHSLDRLVALA